MTAEEGVFGARWLLVHVAGEGDAYYELLGVEGTRLGLVHRDDTPASSVGAWMARLVPGSTSRPAATTLRIVEPAGRLLLSVVSEGADLQRHARVRDGEDRPVGEILKARGMRKIHLDLVSEGSTVGTIDATGWSGRDFRIERGGVEIGRITGNPQGLPVDVAGSPDDHLLELDAPVEEPLSRLLVACASWMDLSLTQLH